MRHSRALMVVLSSDRAGHRCPYSLKEPRADVARRTTEGLCKREIMRCLKRYVAREASRHLRDAAARGPPAVERA